MSRIILNGDSITYGSHDLKNGGWGALLEKHMMPTAQHEVINFAIRGQRIASIVRRFPDQTKVFGQSCSLGVFMLGGRDSYVFPGREPTSLASYEKDLLTLAGICRERRIAPMFIGSYRVDESRTNPTPDNRAILTNERINTFATVNEVIARKVGAPLVDISILNEYPPEEVLADDGAHPSTFGHQLIANAVIEAVEARLKEPLLTYAS